MEKFSMETVESLFEEGVGKHEIFDRAIEAGLDRKEVSKYLSGKSDQDLAKKYDKAIKVLLWVLAMLIFFSIAALSISPALSRAFLIIELIFWPPIIGYIIYLVRKKQTYAYDHLSAILLIVMLKSAVYSAEYFTDLWAVITIGIEFALAFYVLILRKKLLPYQNYLGRKTVGRRETDDGIYIYTNNHAPDNLRQKNKPD